MPGIRLASLAVLSGLVLSDSATAQDHWQQEFFLHYRIEFTNETRSSIPEIRKVLQDFDAWFTKKCPAMRKGLAKSRVTLRLHPRSNKTYTTSYAALYGGPRKRDGVTVYDGTIQIAGPAAFTGRDRSTSGHAKDRHYFRKLLVHEVAPIYLTLYCAAHGERFRGYPNWFVQGMEEYLSVRHSTQYWRTKGVQAYYGRLRKNPDSIDTSFGLIVQDDYNDGFVLCDFIAQKYGEDRLFAILRAKERAFGKRLRKVLGIEFAEFLADLKQWKAAAVIRPKARVVAAPKPRKTAETRIGPLDVLWRVPLTSTSFGGASVADADGDGKLEVAFCTYFHDSRVLVLNGEDGSELWAHRSKPNSAMGECWDASLRFGDVNMDGKLELVVPVSNGCRVHAYDAKTGKEVWTYDAGRGDCIDSPPALVDTNRDGTLDVVFGTFKKRLHVVDGKTGAQLRTVTGFDGFVQTCPLVLDLNGDKFVDYIAGTFKGDHTVRAIDGKTGESLWEYEIATTTGIYHGPSLGDLDGDGKPEVVITAYDGRVSCVDAITGKIEWSVQPGDRYFMAPNAIADVDGDGKPEVVAVSQRLTVIEHDGTVKYSIALAPKNSWAGANRGPSIADLDGDGKLDVAYLMSDGYFAVRRGHDGKLLYDLDPKTYFKGTIASNNNGPVLADLNGDGKLDAFFVVGQGSPRKKGKGVAVCVTGFDGKGEGWYMLRHDTRNTGNVGTPLADVLRRGLPQRTGK